MFCLIIVATTTGNGARFEIKRRFRSGIEFGAWYTLTGGNDITSPGSPSDPYYDQGVFMTIPLNTLLTRDSQAKSRLSLAPWTRDVGQMLEYPGRPLPAGGRSAAEQERPGRAGAFRRSDGPSLRRAVTAIAAQDTGEAIVNGRAPPSGRRHLCARMTRFFQWRTVVMAVGCDGSRPGTAVNIRATFAGGFSKRFRVFQSRP